MTKGDHVWTTSDWSDEFKVEYDVIVNKDLPGTWKSLLHLTTGDNYPRLPAIFLNPDKYFHNCYHVNGNHNYCQNYNYELNKDYHFEISQQRNSKGEAVYSIKVNGETFHEIINTKPVKFKDVKLYLSDPWYETFAPFGKLSNLKVIADLTTLSKYMFAFFHNGTSKKWMTIFSVRSACTFINFEDKFPPAVLFWSARLSIFRKFYPAHLWF